MALDLAHRDENIIFLLDLSITQAIKHFNIKLRFDHFNISSKKIIYFVKFSHKFSYKNQYKPLTHVSSEKKINFPNPKTQANVRPCLTTIKGYFSSKAKLYAC